MNGVVTPEGIVINTDSAKALNTVVGHEVTHILEGTELYDGLKDALFKYAKGKGEFFPRRAELAELYDGIEGADIDSELVADLVGDYLFTDESFIRELSTAHRNVFQKLFDEIKRLCKLATAGSKEARELEKVKQTFEKAYREAGNAQATKNTADGGGVKYSLSQNYDYSKSFEQQVEDYKNGFIPKGDSLIVGATPEVFQKIGFNALPVTINQKHIDYALNGTKNQEHSLGSTLLKQLPTALENPVAVIASRTNSGSSVVALLPFQKDGNTVIAPIYIDGYGFQNSIQIDSNAVTSIYGRKNAVTTLLTDAIQKHNSGTTAVFYLDVAKAAGLYQVQGVTMPNPPSSINGFVASITDQSSPVKPKMTSTTQSQQFKRWFGDWQNAPEKASKIINEDGMPRVVYHGTNGNFNVFQSDSGAYWFSESYDYAESMMEERGGGEVKSAYLNIRNPYYAELEPGKFSDPSAEAPIIRKAQAEGYDGVIIKNTSNDPLVSDTFYVAFEPTQIKSATKNIGTFDGNKPDIRYSLSPEGEGGGGETGGYNVYGEDIRRLDRNDLAPDPETGPLTGDDIAPTMEEIARQEAEKVKSQAPGDLAKYPPAAMRSRGISFLQAVAHQGHGCFVCNQGEIRMQLKDGSGDLGGHRTAEGIQHSLRLILTGNDHHNTMGLHNIQNTHGVSLAGHQRLILEETGICIDGTLGQLHAVGAFDELIAGLVETNVTIATQTQQLQIHAAHAVQQLIIALAFPLCVRIHTIGNIGVIQVDIDMVEQVMPHEISIALIVVSRQTHILIQVHSLYLRKVHIALFVPLDQLLINANGAAAGSQAQNGVGL